VPDAKQVIECPQCQRLHEIDLNETGQRFECACGKWLDVADVGAEAPTAEAGVGGETQKDGSATAAAGKQKANAWAALRANWKLASGVGVGLAALIIGLAFWRGPQFTLGSIRFGGTGGLRAQQPKEDPEVYLRILEDNSRVNEHAEAAAKLLHMGDAVIVPRLCQMAKRPDLVSRPTVLRLLGQKGEEQSLDALVGLLGDPDKTTVFLAVTAVTQIGTPMAENLLRREMQSPVRARELLPSVAAVHNDLAARIVRAALAEPALRTQALQEIAKARLSKCVADVVPIASDRDTDEAERVRAVETLGALDTPEARRALIKLTEDSIVGWKARQILDAKAAH